MVAAIIPVIAQVVLFGGLPLPRPLGGAMPSLVSAHGGAIGERIGRLSLEVTGPVHDIALVLGPADIARQVTEAFHRDREAIVDRIARGQLGLLWATLPGAVKAQIEGYFARAVPMVIDRAIAEIIEAIEDLVDVPGMLSRYFARRHDHLANMVETVAAPAFRVLRYAFPAVLALPLVILELAAPASLAPVVGAATGFIASLGAMTWMFEPPPARWRERMPSWMITPLLPERPMITGLYADTVANDVFKIEAVIDELIAGSGARATRAIIERRVAAIFARMPGRPMLSLIIPPSAMEGMQAAATAELLALLPRAMAEPVFAQRCAARLYAHVTARFDALDEARFLGVQRGILRGELPLLHALTAGAFLLVGLVAAFP
ncbi:hypothetical protein D3874_12365 [Oleomonas cavernae]|uniref:DUF445 family protein n=2 Tax=Oleomonas cavernae TaxID=2320859 RepID=A0A418WCQ9_9PROT|nr:hypothetical protein D3874_12365 [Oleomonas cavernae]